ncbi:MAG: hypothetical protein C4524_00175 [Candidatus Zixiibacteriota bacterium]|nr:MAG: hypothetical protein C4524_00175 [candidate division Zixibacteria bacterium]
MDVNFRDHFRTLWNRYFPGAELPLAFWYTDDETIPENPQTTGGNRCLIANLIRVRQGRPLRFSLEAIGCSGGKRYSGFPAQLRLNFRYFLSCGLPGEVEGERYKQSPELVDRVMASWPKWEAPARYLVFKRWDQIEAGDEPQAVVFFAAPDALSGLFTLAGYDEEDSQAVIAPFGAGCATIVQHPYLQQQSDHPRCILGMFDVSARPYVPAGTLTFAAPMKKFTRMVANMEESFLITDSWGIVCKRMGKHA